ncbi:phage antirepressor KilAC domain-containing protein [Bacillus sp. B-jedd]|uniref:phage antirepressor KilAC domain-containing protein n=1 Tax=Bacillus sp. B-jedd TaxID=1476857 RepID=UPI0005155AAB|nr:phage antirepressor KilAC domain-containing protein [Bacillus sp. B-jedd]CEG29815.1 antirepressor, phage associated [Bacillus sp. B-jedd]
MLSNPLVINHNTFGELLIIVEHGKPLFPATEAAKTLGYSNPQKAIRDHCKEDGCTIRSVTDSMGRPQQKKFINEGNLYRLIVKSHLPEAERFERWVFDEVLPTVRNTGGYVSNEDMFLQTYLPYADNQTKMLFKATLETVRKQNEQMAIMQPKADYFDALVDRNLLTNFRDTAKELHIGERGFIKWLQENGFVYRDLSGKLKPYGKHVPELFNIKEFERNGKAGVQTLITPRGRETFRLLLEKAVS